MFTYSVSNPHYNSPDLLARMLKSIPERDDIQVIIVDDGSSAGNVEKLKELSHKNLELILLPENQGGGFARNVGLSKATGKWFISVDADDYFSANAFDVFDEQIKNKKIEVLYFCVQILNELLKPIVASHSIPPNVGVKNYLKTHSRNSELFLRFGVTESWNKLVSMEFIKKNNICYENTRINIDVYYALCIGYTEHYFQVIDDVLYNIVHTSNSICRKKRDVEREWNFFMQVVKRNSFYKIIGLRKHPYYRMECLYYPMMLKRHGLRGLLNFCKNKYVRREEVELARKKYLNILTRKYGMY